MNVYGHKISPSQITACFEAMKGQFRTADIEERAVVAGVSKAASGRRPAADLAQRLVRKSALEGKIRKVNGRYNLWEQVVASHVTTAQASPTKRELFDQVQARLARGGMPDEEASDWAKRLKVARNNSHGEWPELPASTFQLPIEILPRNHTLWCALGNQNIRTIGDIYARTPDDIRKCRNIGKTHLSFLINGLSEMAEHADEMPNSLSVPPPFNLVAAFDEAWQTLGAADQRLLQDIWIGTPASVIAQQIGIPRTKIYQRVHKALEHLWESTLRMRVWRQFIRANPQTFSLAALQGPYAARHSTSNYLKALSATFENSGFRL